MTESFKSTVAPENTSAGVEHGWKSAGIAVFVRENLSGSRVRVVLVSLLLLIPCIWQRRIEAGDLRSHLYNAWLVQLIERHQAPGLWLARVWNNVLFDYLLSGLGRVFGLMEGARIATAVVVLIFFWGAFAFVRVASERDAWSVTPVLACVTYGWTFQEGFLNYYLSVGLAFIGLAVFRSRSPWRWVVLAALAPFVFLAHPLGFAWMLSALFYLTLSQVCSPRFRALPFLLAGAFIAVLRFLLQLRYWVQFPETSFLYNAGFYNGIDQLVLAKRYLLPVLLMGFALSVAAISQVLREKSFSKSLKRSSIALQLYLISLASVLFIPNAIFLPVYGAPISALTTRLTLISAVLFCATLATVTLRKWHLLILCGSAALFFAFLYQDSGVLNGMEDQIERLVHNLPPGQRVISTIAGPPKYRFSTKHLLDPSCIGRCFSYGNYEASSKQFRVRASEGNPFVVSDIHDATLMEEGRYVVQEKDRPLYQIYQCSQDWTQLCIRQLNQGERNDLLGVHAERVPARP